MSVIFALSSVRVTLPDNSLPEEPGDFSAQIVRPTISGALIGAEIATDLLAITTVTWNNLIDTDYTALRNFIITTTKRSINSFTYTDRLGDDYTAHYERGIPGSRTSNGIHWSVELTLRLFTL